MKQAINEFRQDKNSFLLCVAICSTIWFLAVCILFGVYIWRSFDNQVSIEQTAMDNYYNNQEIHK